MAKEHRRDTKTPARVSDLLAQPSLDIYVPFCVLFTVEDQDDVPLRVYVGDFTL